MNERERMRKLAFLKYSIMNHLTYISLAVLYKKV